MAEKAIVGEPLPRWTLESSTVCIPKGAFHEDAARVVRRPGELRLITLMNTVGKILARQAHAALADVAAESVATPQRGFIANRSIDDNIFELSGSLLEFSQCGDRAGLLLVDFAAAFPSLSRKFMFAVLWAMRLPTGLLHLIEELYRDLDTGVLLNGAEVCRIKLASGIKQGCPLSGTLFALCLDPLIRLYGTNHFLLEQVVRLRRRHRHRHDEH